MKKRYKKVPLLRRSPNLRKYLIQLDQLIIKLVQELNQGLARSGFQLYLNRLKFCYLLNLILNFLTHFYLLNMMQYLKIITLDFYLKIQILSNIPIKLII